MRSEDKRCLLGKVEGEAENVEVAAVIRLVEAVLATLAVGRRDSGDRPGNKM
jgi:hypothetical protein